MVALAVANALNLQKSRRLQAELEVKNARLGLLLDLTNNMAASLELHEVLRQVTIGARRLTRSDVALLGLQDLENGRWQVKAFAPDDTLLDDEEADVLAEILGARVLSTGKPWTGNADIAARINATANSATAAAGCQNSCALPRLTRGRVFGILALASCEDDPYASAEIHHLRHLSGDAAM